MKLFNEIEAHCPKCNPNYRTWRVKYIESSPAQLFLGVETKAFSESVLWTCSRCGYEDQTYPYDYKKEVI
ncbi:hypothetical protein LCGC14_0950350 [marine sediment metagenome]|uniref:Uncharacterized protein n=1 Tax=marine sediment metagenome TaxID=412755 RepID=A0A0F9R0Y6_9ZZZZ